jgi:succinoglycan biosynthesis transport protein ExoP
MFKELWLRKIQCRAAKLLSLNQPATLMAHKRANLRWAGVPIMSREFLNRREESEDALDLPRLWRSVVRRKSWIILPTILAFAAALAVIAVVPPRYTGVAKVLLENQESYFTKPDKAATEQPVAIDPEAVQSQAEAIASTTLARKAIVKLDLANRPEFNQSAAPSLIETVMSLLGLNKRQPGRTTEDRLADAFLSHLSAFPVAKTRVIQIEFVSQDPEFAARGANVVAQLFLDSQEQAKKDSAKAASEWLAGKITELRAKVADDDAKVEAFRAQSGLLATGLNQTASSQQLSDINAQLAAARSAQATAQAKAQMLRSLMRQGKLGDDPDLARDDSLRRLSEQLVALKAQIAQESRTLLPEHPHMKELQAQMSELQSQIRLAAERTSRALENEARLAGDQVESLTATLAAQAKTVAAGNQDDVQLRALQLDANSARDQLESYVQKYREAIARDADNAAPADARIIAPANEPRTPTFPKKVPTLLLGTLAGLLLSAGVVVSRALLEGGEEAPIVRRSYLSEKVVEEDSEPPVKTTAPSPSPSLSPAPLPLAEREAEEPEIDESSGRADFHKIDALVEHVVGRAKPEETRFVMIVDGGDGTAHPVALELGRKLSSRGRAVLVDLGPSNRFIDILRHDGEAPSHVLGLGDVLADDAGFEDSLYRDVASRLDVIPAGVRAPIAEGLDEVLVALAETHGFVVVHASSWRKEIALTAAELIREVVLVAAPSNLSAELSHAEGEIDAKLLSFAASGGRPRLDKAA